jgi:hypothetical protein
MLEFLPSFSIRAAPIHSLDKASIRAFSQDVKTCLFRSALLLATLLTITACKFPHPPPVPGPVQPPSPPNTQH